MKALRQLKLAERARRTLLPTTYYLLPTAYYPLPTTYLHLAEGVGHPVRDGVVGKVERREAGERAEALGQRKVELVRVEPQVAQPLR